MALANYPDLQAQVTLYLDRADQAANLPNYVLLCEARMNRKLARLGAGELVSTALTLTGNIETLALPADFNGARAASIVSGSYFPLEWVPPNKLDELFPSTAIRRPRVYTVTGVDGVTGGLQMLFRPIPDGNYVLRLTYYKKLATITTGGGTNWMMTNYPDAYLYGTLLEATAGIKDPDVAKWQQAYQTAFDDIQDQDNAQRWSGPLRAAPGVRLIDGN